MMTTTSSIRSAVRCALLTSAVAAVLPVSAQDENIQEVVVTGTRIVRPDFTSDSPVTSVTADVLSQTGSNSIETVLNQLPQFVPSVSTTSNNPGNGGQANIVRWMTTGRRIESSLRWRLRSLETRSCVFE